MREHGLHGIVTGLEGIKTMGSLEDKLDRLLVSFKDAKVGSFKEVVCLSSDVHLDCTFRVV